MCGRSIAESGFYAVLQHSLWAWLNRVPLASNKAIIPGPARILDELPTPELFPEGGKLPIVV